MMNDANDYPLGYSEQEARRLAEQGVKQTEYRVHGVRVERFIPLTPAQVPRPIVFVHGGCHGSWSWVHFLPYFAQAGWDCHALNWFGHNGSAPHPEVGLLQRGIADVIEEISHVVGQLEESPVIVAHSMGALAAQKYAECHPVSALVLLTPVVPTEVGGGDVIDLPIDPNQPWEPPPFEIARDLFFRGLEEDEARTYFEKLCPESPKAVYEATRWTVPIDRVRVSGPILVVSSELDHLTPPASGRSLATFYGADYRYLRGRSHNVLLESKWRETASMVAAWLDRETRIVAA
jgi:pimeloyl-ACP methyl ester carboxylesterase